jgi:uncharacterized protein
VNAHHWRGSKFAIVLSANDPRVVSLVTLIQSGDTSGLMALLRDHLSLVTNRFGDEEMSRTVLHIATDWPGHFPRVADTIAILVDAGALVNARFAGSHRETPLHWAASSNDVEAITALLKAGADIEADGAVLTDGTPLSDAVVFAQWNAAHLLVENGATMTIWQAAALGEVLEMQRHLESSSITEQDITNACWHACRAGQLKAVQALTGRGADIDWLGYDQMTSREAASASDNADLVMWLLSR